MRVVVLAAVSERAVEVRGLPAFVLPPPVTVLSGGPGTGRDRAPNGCTFGSLVPSTVRRLIEDQQLGALHHVSRQIIEPQSTHPSGQPGRTVCISTIK